jgi:tRNA-2-methylthio-N6-dimethylallyladenosine synthase
VFSPREGTEAATMTADFVAPEIVKERMARLTDLVEGIGKTKHAARLGCVEEVLVDGPSKTDPAMWSGRTRHNKLLHFAPTVGADGGEVSVHGGDLVQVRVTKTAPHWMSGELVGMVRPGRRRKVRIPVAVV